MRTLQEKYNAVLEGNFSKTQFRRDAAIEMPQFVSTVNSFDDTVAILKNKGIVTEAKAQEPKYSTAKPADTIAPDVLDTGIKFELDKKYGTLDVTPEQYEKCKEMAIKNLAKDVLYYVKQDSVQLDTPGEKMEKVSLKEGKEEAWKEFQKKHNVTDKTIKVARKDFEKEWEAGNLKEEAEVNETVDTDELRARIANILKGQLTSLRKIGGDAIIEDYIETQIQAYLDGDVDIEEPMEVVNDFRYYMDDNSRAAADFNADLEPDDTTPETLEEDDEESPEDYANANAGSPMHAPPGLEEGEVVDLPMTAAGYSRGETYNTEKYGKVKIIDQLDGDDIPAAYGRFRVEKINEEDKDKPSFYDYPENKHLDDRDPEERRKALKEMFKKIIVNLINE